MCGVSHTMDPVLQPQELRLGSFLCPLADFLTGKASQSPERGTVCVEDFAF